MSNFDQLDVTNTVRKLMTLLAYVTLTPVLMASHDQNVMLHTVFGQLDIINALVLLTMPLAAQDVDASANYAK